MWSLNIFVLYKSAVFMEEKTQLGTPIVKLKYKISKYEILW